MIRTWDFQTEPCFGLSLTSEFRCHASVPHLEAFYLVNKLKFLWISASLFFSLFFCVLWKIQTCDLMDLAEGIQCWSAILICYLTRGPSKNAKPAMVCTANDLQEWKDFPKGLRVLLLEGDSSSAAEIREQLEAVDYNGETFWIPS